MFLRFIAVLGLICVMSASGIAQPPQPQASPILLDSDIRIFTVAAALNVATEEGGGPLGKELDPDLVRRLKTFYTVHMANRPAEAQFAQYIGLAVSLTDPPELKPRVKEEQLPDETRALLGYLDLLREFYTKAHISQRWIELRPYYDAELAGLRPKVSNALLQTDAYLRTSLTGSSSRVMHINAELVAPTNSVNMRVYKTEYYVVLGPSTTSNTDDVRHAYLHFHLDDLVNRGLSRVADKEKMLELVSGEKGVDTTYTRDFGLMTVESLIRAVELRMDRVTAARAKDVVANAYRSGLLLTPYFYDQLQSYQAGTENIRDAFTVMARGIDFRAERDRFQATFHSIPVPQKQVVSVEVPVAPEPVDPVHELLVEATAAFNNMDNDGARALFEKVIRQHDPNNGSALYGLALIASRASDIEQSQLYFDRTVKSNSADPSMKVWSYIYLGHIADLQCQRDRATEYYRQAVKAGDDSRGAQASANSGLAKAFGDQCH